MPTYDYRCETCGHQFEEYQSITASPLRKCPACGKRSLRRLLGSGGAIIFKGSGFYQTDYRSSSYKQAAEAEQKARTPSKDGQDSGAKSTEKAASAGGSEKSSTPAPDARKAG